MRQQQCEQCGPKGCFNAAVLVSTAVEHAMHCADYCPFLCGSASCPYGGARTRFMAQRFRAEIKKNCRLRSIISMQLKKRKRNSYSVFGEGLDVFPSNWAGFRPCRGTNGECSGAMQHHSSLVRQTFAEAGAEVVAEGAAGSDCSAPRA